MIHVGVVQYDGDDGELKLQYHEDICLGELIRNCCVNLGFRYKVKYGINSNYYW